MAALTNGCLIFHFLNSRFCKDGWRKLKDTEAEGGGVGGQRWKMGNYWKHPQILGGHISSMQWVFVTANSCVFWCSESKNSLVTPHAPPHFTVPISCQFNLRPTVRHSSLAQPCLPRRQYKWMRCHFKVHLKLSVLSIVSKVGNIFSSTVSSWDGASSTGKKRKKKKSQENEQEVLLVLVLSADRCCMRKYLINLLSWTYSVEHQQSDGTGEKCVWLNCDGGLAWIEVWKVCVRELKKNELRSDYIILRVDVFANVPF